MGQGPTPDRRLGLALRPRRHGYLDDAERRPVRESAPQERHGDIIDGDVAPRPSLEPPVVRVAVEDGGHRIVGQRLLQPAGAQEGKDLRRLALHGRPNGGIVEQGDPLARIVSSRGQNRTR